MWLTAVTNKLYAQWLNHARNLLFAHSRLKWVFRAGDQSRPFYPPQHVLLHQVGRKGVLVWLSRNEPNYLSMTMQFLSLALLSGLRTQHCHELSVGHRCSSNPALLWLWYRSTAAALIDSQTGNLHIPQVWP